MTRDALLGWLQAFAAVLGLLAIPWVMGYLALAMGAMG